MAEPAWKMPIERQEDPDDGVSEYVIVYSKRKDRRGLSNPTGERLPTRAEEEERRKAAEERARAAEAEVERLRAEIARLRGG